jgi:ubiquinone/menaquinone biosynthesis C-methylase UbiE
MASDTITAEQARAFYDRLGAEHDLSDWYEGRAKLRGLELLDLERGQRVLNIGVGTGKEHILIQETIGPRGMAVGVDLSPVMLGLARVRSRAPIAGADARSLPFPDHSFDRVYCAYLLDLIGGDDLHTVLGELRRVLRPGGRAVLVSLTEGVDPMSRAVIGAWKLAYAVDPMLCGGCRPLQLAGIAAEAGLPLIEGEVVVQSGMPSEVVAVARP